MTDKEAPKRIWASEDSRQWSSIKFRDNDIKYVHANYQHACFQAAVSLHHHLFKITDTLLNRPDVGEREIADMLDDAQIALDKWGRFLDEEEE